MRRQLLVRSGLAQQGILSGFLDCTLTFLFCGPPWPGAGVELDGPEPEAGI